ncbi:cytochrome P450 9e2 isoform X2 [Folsomia candida]|uniref:cytochrome P450 9e2 isoform X2 n=1 Tax=Folsomia candida TaxID=158441 RepID=UPI001604FFB6|nr:cytochrome P450 9e2 isoform X2 [Folsomia candida]
MWIYYFLTLIIILYVTFKLFSNRVHNYWKKYGFNSATSSEIKQGSKNYPTSIKKGGIECLTYKYFKDLGLPIGGTFEALNPQLYVTDAALAKKIMVEDAHHFVDRRELYEPQRNPLLGRMLSFRRGDEWKRLRSLLSPAFTPAKMKDIFPLFIENCQQLVATIEITNKDYPVRLDIHETIGRFTMDVISSTVFGIRTESQTNNDSIFYEMGKKLQVLTLKLVFARITAKFLPKLAKFLHISTFDTSALEFFAQTTKNIVQERNKSGVINRRRDMIDILLSNNASGELSEDDIVSQAVLFYILGFDTTNSLLEICCIVLANHPKIQEKLRREVADSGFDEHGNTNSYEVLTEMPYMNKVITETLRLYPPSTRTERLCTTEYLVPGTNLTIPINSQIVIPIYALQTDPDLWEDSHKFLPERCCTNQSAYNPFGAGPRSCLDLTISRA